MENHECHKKARILGSGRAIPPWTANDLSQRMPANKCIRVKNVSLHITIILL